MGPRRDLLARPLTAGERGEVVDPLLVPLGHLSHRGPGTLDVAPGQFVSIGYSSAASVVTKLTPEIRSRVDHGTEVLVWVP